MTINLYPPIYYELADIPHTKVNNRDSPSYELVIFTFPKLGKRYKLFLSIRKIPKLFHLTWKVVDDYQGNVLNIVSLEHILEQVNEEGQSFLLFHLNIFKEQMNTPFEKELKNV